MNITTTKILMCLSPLLLFSCSSETSNAAAPTTTEEAAPEDGGAAGEIDAAAEKATDMAEDAKTEVDKLKVEAGTDK